MRRWAGRLVAVLLMAPLGSASAQRLVRPLQDPALRPGDVLRINVWRHAELSGDFVVAPDSTLVDPVYQVVKVAGVPLSVVRERLRGVLSTYEQGVPFVVEPVFPVTVAGEEPQPNTSRPPHREHNSEKVKHSHDTTHRNAHCQKQNKINRNNKEIDMTIKSDP